MTNGFVPLDPYKADNRNPWSCGLYPLEKKLRVCDRHPRKPATEMIKIRSTDSEIDLCKQCAEEINKFISNPKKESVERKPFWEKRKSA